MKEATINKTDNIILIKFKVPDSTEWKSTLDFVKTLSGREFLPKQKQWKAPALKENIEALRQNGFEVLGDTDKEQLNENNPLDSPKLWEHIEIDEEMFPDLRPYQIDSLRFLKWREGRGLICDDMGIGKTVQALSYCKMYPEKQPVLIVVPASIKLQWLKEYLKWVENTSHIEILRGKSPFPLNDNMNYIINWDILFNWTGHIEKIKIINERGEEIEKIKYIWDGVLLDIPFQIIIGDEFQAIGNSGSLRSKAFKKLAKRIPEFIGLSGTPIRSRPEQFFNALSLVNPTCFSNEWKFKWRYCDPKSNGFGMDFKGATNVEELHELVSQVIIRRRKKDVLKDLPAKVRTIVPLEISDRSSYDEKVKQFQDTEFARKIEQRNELENLKYSAFDLKKDMIIKWIKDFLDSGEKLVVYAWHRAVISFLVEQFPDIHVKIDGGTPPENRFGIVERFQTDDQIRLFFGNIIAAGVGTDGLQNACSNAAFVELIWTPTDHAQAEDRLHRIGQGGSVNIYYLIAPGTVEDILMGILDRKLITIEAVIDGTEPGEMDLFEELLKKI